MAAWSSLDHMVAQLRTKCLLLIQKLHNHPFPCHMSFERLFPKSRDKGGKIDVHLVFAVTRGATPSTRPMPGNPAPRIRTRGNSTQGLHDCWLVGYILLDMV